MVVVAPVNLHVVSHCVISTSLLFFPLGEITKSVISPTARFSIFVLFLFNFFKSSTSLSANPSTTLWTFHWMKQWIINAIFCGCFGMIELVLYDNICQRSLSRCESIEYPEINIEQTNADLTLRWFKIRQFQIWRPASSQRKSREPPQQTLHRQRGLGSAGDLKFQLSNKKKLSKYFNFRPSLFKKNPFNHNLYLCLLAWEVSKDLKAPQLE